MKLKHFLLTILFVAVLPTNFAAQAGTVDLRFANPTFNNCAAASGTFCVTVQVKAATGTLQLANSTIFVNYNYNAIKDPVLTNLNFDAADGYGAPASFNLQTADPVATNTGEFNWYIDAGSGTFTPAAGTPTLNSTTWTDAYQLCFTIVNSAASANLQFNAGVTGFNDLTNNMTSMHTNGTFTPLAQSMACPKEVKLKAYLEGPYDVANHNMKKALNPTYIPRNHPYTVAPYNYTGSEALYSIPANMVDWVLVSAATAQTNASVVETRAGILNQDGTITDVATGSTGLNFFNLGTGNYYFIVRHRNHLSVVTTTSFTVPNAVLYSLSTSSTNQKQVETGIYALKAGNANNNDLSTKALPAGASYNKNMLINSNDFTVWKASNPIVNKYEPADFNLDKLVNSNDFTLWKNNNPTLGTAALSY